jgi:zinc D-Ala-D-Ala carboxypeptidase
VKRFLILACALGLASAEPLPECRYDDLPTPHQAYDAWALTLLDPIHQLPPDYEPPDLAPLREAGLASDLKVRALLLDDLRELLEDAARAGHPLEVQSAYRSYAYQARTFDSWVARLGREAALKSSARPGHSEHQLGTALDFRSAGGPAPWDLPDWAKTPAGAWMAANAHRYGFVMSYPEGQDAVTCYIYEPWHYRYVGRERAQAVRESGLSLREWLWERQ